MDQAEKVSSFKIIDLWIDLADAKKETPKSPSKIADIFSDIMAYYGSAGMLSFDR